MPPIDSQPNRNTASNQISSMSEQDILNDILNQEKQIIGSYSVFLTEASCENLRQVLNDSFNQVAQDQFKVFEAMKRKGYYQTKDAATADVQSAKQTFANMQSQLV